MGTNSAGEIIDDTTVFFAVPNGNNDQRTGINASSANPGSALTHKLERKLRTPKAPQSNALVDKHSVENGHSESSSTPKIAIVHPSQLLIPAKSASDQPLVVYDLDSDEEVEFSRTPKTKCASNKEASARLLSNDFDVELHSDDDDGDSLELIRPKPVPARCVCCKSSCTIL